MTLPIVLLPLLFFITSISSLQKIQLLILLQFYLLIFLTTQNIVFIRRFPNQQRIPVVDVDRFHLSSFSSTIRLLSLQYYLRWFHNFNPSPTRIYFSVLTDINLLRSFGPEFQGMYTLSDTYYYHKSVFHPLVFHKETSCKLTIRTI